MEFSISNSRTQQTACLVVGLFEAAAFSPSAKTVDSATQGLLSRLLQSGDITGRAGTTLLLHDVPLLTATRLLVVGLGKKKTFHEKEYRAAVATAIKTLDGTGATDALLTLTELSVPQHDTNWCIRQATAIALESLYRFDQLKSKKDDRAHPLQSLTLLVEHRKDIKPAQIACREGQAIAAGSTLMKDLANLPGNHCTPTVLAEEARKLASEHGLSIEILERADMASLGMNALLAVTLGSHQPPKFIVLQHNGGKPTDKPIVLVGKGITFDTGGISLKPGAEMDEMKFDMSGAASVMGTMKAAAQLKLPLNIVALIPAVENMPGGAASRPGDVVTSMSGQTIEILNTDAEGRLILCDVLTYAERFQPACVIDVATLTGACVIALGSVATGLFANKERLARELKQAGNVAFDRVWQLPLWEDYQEQLKSNFADMANIGGRPAGTITAACFLSRFTKKYDWAHLDIAGTSYQSGKDKGSTGRPVPLLVHFLLARA